MYAKPHQNIILYVKNKIKRLNIWRIKNIFVPLRIEKMLMQNNSITHRFFVPLGYTFSWAFGIFLGGNFLFGDKNISLANDITTLLYSAFSVYFAFLLECVFIFIDCGAIYKDESFSGKIFNLVAGILFHFFTTMWLVGMIKADVNNTLVYALIIWVVIFKFGISLMLPNIKIWLTDTKIRTITSNQVK